MADKRNTPQKDMIRRALCGTRDHPTAAMVYERVHEVQPTISRSTVYRVLGQMAEEGTARRLGLAGSDSRYDGDTRPHGHARCRLCGAIGDVSPVSLTEPEDTSGFLLEEFQVEYRGLCPRCRKAAEEDRRA